MASCVSNPAHCSDLSGAESGACFAEPDFPWPGPFPPPTPLEQGYRPATLFVGFSGTMGLSDFPDPFIGVVLPEDSRHGPASSGPNLGSPGSRARCVRTCLG